MLKIFQDSHPNINMAQELSKQPLIKEASAKLASKAIERKEKAIDKKVRPPPYFHAPSGL